MSAVSYSASRSSLAAATGGDTARPVLFFRLRDCWMSWNAARRTALEYGYARVFWYPDGVDDWTEWALPVERIAPR